MAESWEEQLKARVAAVDKKLQAAVDSRFEDTEFLVEADDFAKHALWREYNTKVQWEQDSFGKALQVGQLAGYPVFVSLSWAKLNGHRICFYTSNSRVVDWTMIEDWLNTVCYPLWDNGTRYAHADASNFHHCIEHVKRK